MAIPGKPDRGRDDHRFIPRTVDDARAGIHGTMVLHRFLLAPMRAIVCEGRRP